jgi:2-keto-3-deoxy-L-rhamnonate aldolase RhmA
MSRLEAAIQRRNGLPILGAAVHRYNPDFLEIVKLLGFQIVWIELEHGLMSFSEAADLCRAASGLGLLSMLRIPDVRRENALKAAECGPDIIDLPMANSPQAAEELVRFCRYPPLGQRGFFSSSRAVQFGVQGLGAPLHRRVNDELTLVVQIETREAVENVEAICSVPGIDGVFLGTGDLSMSLGHSDDAQHPNVQQAIDQTLAAAKKHGKRIFAPSAPGDVNTWRTRGASVVFFCSDTSCMTSGARKALEAASASLGAAQSLETE